MRVCVFFFFQSGEGGGGHRWNFAMFALVFLRSSASFCSSTITYHGDDFSKRAVFLQQYITYICITSMLYVNVCMVK